MFRARLKTAVSTARPPPGDNKGWNTFASWWEWSFYSSTSACLIDPLGVIEVTLSRLKHFSRLGRGGNVDVMALTYWSLFRLIILCFKDLGDLQAKETPSGSPSMFLEMT